VAGVLGNHPEFLRNTTRKNIANTQHGTRNNQNLSPCTFFKLSGSSSRRILSPRLTILVSTSYRGRPLPLSSARQVPVATVYPPLIHTPNHADTTPHATYNRRSPKIRSLYGWRCWRSVSQICHKLSTLLVTIRERPSCPFEKRLFSWIPNIGQRCIAKALARCGRASPLSKWLPVTTFFTGSIHHDRVLLCVLGYPQSTIICSSFQAVIIAKMMAKRHSPAFQKEKKRRSFFLHGEHRGSHLRTSHSASHRAHSFRIHGLIVEPRDKDAKRNPFGLMIDDLRFMI